MSKYSTATIYVGTYGKYNDGSLHGEWIDLEGLDKESFYEKIKELHSDEEDPEFMFQDLEGFAYVIAGESGFNKGAWEALEVWQELDEEEREAFGIWCDHMGSLDGCEDWRDQYAGQYESVEAFADELIDQGALGEIPESLSAYIDVAKYARDLELGGDIWEEEGHIFWNR
jgi:antirestriction protein